MVISPALSYSPAYLNSLSSPRDYTQEFQTAFENDDLDRVCHLLELGGSPYQQIEFNEKVALALAQEIFKNYTIGREELIELILNEGPKAEDSLQRIQSSEGLLTEMLKKWTYVKQRLQLNPASVSTQELQELLMAHYALSDILPSKENGPSGYIAQPSLMVLAISMNCPKLIHKLIDKGFNFADPDSLESLKSVSYSIFDRTSGFGEGGVIPAFICPCTYVKDYFSDFELPDLKFQKEKANFERNVKGSEILLEFAPEPIFGTIECSVDLDVIRPEVIDILIAQGVSHKDILEFDSGSLSELGIDESHEMINFLASRGFLVSTYFRKKT
ncbi:MAG: hypothetical protein S4CHLAM6_00140 [Chlamydiae bacterium]|nr:hypothetical protein [Chlamydiota bacterium]